MSSWLETGAVVVIVGAAIFWALRAARRSFKKGTVCSTCGDAGSCPLAGKKDPLTDLGKMPSETKTRC